MFDFSVTVWLLGLRFFSRIISRLSKFNQDRDHACYSMFGTFSRVKAKVMDKATSDFRPALHGKAPSGGSG